MIARLISAPLLLRVRASLLREVIARASTCVALKQPMPVHV